MCTSAAGKGVHHVHAGKEAAEGASAETKCCERIHEGGCHGHLLLLLLHHHVVT